MIILMEFPLIQFIPPIAILLTALQSQPRNFRSQVHRGADVVNVDRFVRVVDDCRCSLSRLAQEQAKVVFELDAVRR